MAIAAHFENSPGRSREPRRSLQLEAPGALPSGDEATVLVHNVSATGLLLESPVALAVGERIGIELPNAGASWAKVVWVSGNIYGCQFEKPVSAATLSAAQLRSAVGLELAEPDLAGPDPAGPDLAGLEQDAETRSKPVPDASFGFRLQRLRKQLGLRQSDIASKLAVSKPTVWAWEHGKAMPVAHRLDALAQMLGVSKQDLLPGPDAAVVEELTAKARSQIAAAVGTAPGNVKIWVEL